MAWKRPLRPTTATPNLLPVAGSQAAIQWLPALLPQAAVACIAPLYAEHPQAWQQAGHKVRYLQNATLPRALAVATPYLLLCNPNNPTADRHPPSWCSMPPASCTSAAAG